MKTLDELKQDLADLEALVSVQPWKDPAVTNRVDTLKLAVGFMQIAELRKQSLSELLAEVNGYWEAR